MLKTDTHDGSRMRSVQPIRSSSAHEDVVGSILDVECLSQWLVDRVAREMGLAENALDPSTAFVECGLGSVQLACIRLDLEEWIGRRVPETLFFRPGITIEDVAVCLADY